MIRRICGIAALLALSLAPTTLYAQRGSGVTASEQGVLVDVQDADLRMVIAALAEAGGLNVFYQDLPPRRVTLRLVNPVPRSDVRGLLRTIIESAGLELRDEATILRIVVPEVSPPPAPAPQASSAIQLFVYRLKHAPANRLAATLQSLFGLAPGAHPQASAGPASLSEQLRNQQVPPGLTEPAAPPGGGNTTLVLGSRMQGEVQIVPDELTNSLLVRASAADWDVIRSAIEALDLRPLQVLVEVLIAEVRRSSLLDLGLSVSTPLKREPRTGAKIGGELVGPSSGDVAIKILNLGRVEADILISALYSRSDVTILSRPVLLAQNNQDARILVGSQRPFVQVFRALPTDAAVRDQVVQYRDVGTSLRIRPTINFDGYVSLDLLQEVSTATSEVQFGAPVISTREASTRLLVRDGQTAVIGGLSDRQQDKTRGGIPILRDIPLLGRLFGSTHDNKLQTELFLFITPHIVSSDADVDRMRRAVESNAELLRKKLKDDKPILQPDQEQR